MSAAVLAACTAATAPVPAPKAELSSPDGKLKMAFYLSEEGTPRYALANRERLRYTNRLR